MDTPGRARNAKARASQAVHEGRISKATEEQIDRKADKVLGKTQREHDKDHKKAKEVSERVMKENPHNRKRKRA